MRAPSVVKRQRTGPRLALRAVCQAVTRSASDSGVGMPLSQHLAGKDSEAGSLRKELKRYVKPPR